MSAVLTDSVFSQDSHLKGLIKTVIREDKTLMKSVFIELLEEDTEFKEYISGMILADQDYSIVIFLKFSWGLHNDS